MFGIGAPELIVILIIGLIVFGPGKLPELGRTMGKTIREFRKVSNGIMEDEPVEKTAKKLEASTEEKKVDESAEPSGMVDGKDKQ
ncbi:MAG: twin-arginine translocase TatA/TatE family subunit [Anaerovibrio sp.]|nr:twin-arginine translocase TatA/TatE family subunit [Anaerovibrio sp.]